MASGSRSPELVGWLRCGLVLVLLVVRLWWQELFPTGELNPGISVNKADLWSSSPLVVSHAAGRSSFSFSIKLPWWKAKEQATGTGSLNKCGHLRSDEVDVEISLLAGLGGEGENRRLDGDGAVFFPLAGRGGEEEEGEGAAGVGLFWWGSVEDGQRLRLPHSFEAVMTRWWRLGEVSPPMVFQQSRFQCSCRMDLAVLQRSVSAIEP